MTSALALPGPEAPPGYLRLVAHPVRWRLLRELVASDRAVRELTQLVDEPQSLVSYHLRQLRDGGLVSARRSSADGRDTYYAIDLARCRGELQAAGGALHPGAVARPGAAPARRTARRSGRRPRVLFLCTGNSARSQIAEALLEHMSDGTVEAVSAGSHPKPLHPNAVRVLRKRGIDISREPHQAPRRVPRAAVRPGDHAVRPRPRGLPEFPAHPQLVHWSVPDPALEGSTNRASYPAFERTAAELETRISFLLHLLSEPTTRRSTHANR